MQKNLMSREVIRYTSSGPNTLNLYSHLRTAFSSLRTTSGRQQKVTKINALCYLIFSETIQFLSTWFAVKEVEFLCLSSASLHSKPLPIV